MSLLASTINGAGYVLSNGEDKDNGNGFEFTRRKRWPQLLMQELVGSALFCVKPTLAETSSTTENENAAKRYDWRVLMVSPSIEEMIGQSPQSVEGKDILDIVYESDQPNFQKFLTNLLAPRASPHDSESSTTTMTSVNTLNTSVNTLNTPLQPIATSSRSQTTYVRINVKPAPGSRRGSPTKPAPSTTQSGQVVWEVRAHATGVERPPGEAEERTAQLGIGGNGTVSQREAGSEGDMKGKAIWVMGRAIPESNGEGEGNGQSLDAFLELKMENEKLRAELRELQLEYGEEDLPVPSYLDTSPSRPSTSIANASSPSSSAEDSQSASSSPSSSSPDYSAPSNKPIIAARPGRPPKDPAAREKKRAKKAANTQLARVQAAGGEGEGGHVCVTCGRTQSPEWRKGPMGPKTLCNACGLRWAKRNSSAPTRKERKTK